MALRRSFPAPSLSKFVSFLCLEWLRLAGPYGPHVQAAAEGLLRSRSHTQPLGSLCQCSITCTAQKCSWCSEGTSCVPVCAHCLLSWHWAPLKRPWFFKHPIMFKNIIPPNIIKVTPMLLHAEQPQLSTSHHRRASPGALSYS